MISSGALPCLRTSCNRWVPSRSNSPSASRPARVARVRSRLTRGLRRLLIRGEEESRERLRTLRVCAVQALVNAQIFAVELEAIDGRDFAFDSFRCQIFNHLFDHLVLDGCMVDGIRGEKFEKLPNLRSNDFRSIRNFQNDHVVGCRYPTKLVRMGRLELPRCCHH